MWQSLIRSLVSAADFTPAGIARRLLAEQQRGINAEQVATRIAAMPGIDDFLQGHRGQDFWSRLMADPGARDAIHPMHRQALKNYICQVVDAVRRLRGITN